MDSFVVWAGWDRDLGGILAMATWIAATAWHCWVSFCPLKQTIGWPLCPLPQLYSFFGAPKSRTDIPHLSLTTSSLLYYHPPLFCLPSLHAPSHPSFLSFTFLQVSPMCCLCPQPTGHGLPFSPHLPHTYNMFSMPLLPPFLHSCPGFLSACPSCCVPFCQFCAILPNNN